VDNNNIRKALFVGLRPLHVTIMRYVEECSGIWKRACHSKCRF